MIEESTANSSMALPAVGTPAAVRPRILFFAEAVTLAHVARSHTHLSALDPQLYDMCLACDPRYDRLF